MNKLILIFALPFFCGCGSSTTSIEATDSWVNKTKEEVIKSWGKDTVRSIPHNTDEVLIYGQAGTIDSKPTSDATESGTNRKIKQPPTPQINYRVYTYFYLNDKKVVSWKVEYKYDGGKSKK